MNDAPFRIYLVKPKSDAPFSAVFEDYESARAYVDSSTSGAELAGPYVFAAGGTYEDGFKAGYRVAAAKDET